MGDVILVMRVLPDGPESTAKVKSALEALSPERLEEEPIGFGVVAFKFTIIIPDEGGKQEELENKISAIEGVSQSEVLMASRAM
jgi:elongation factor 1-beta